MAQGPPNSQQTQKGLQSTVAATVPTNFLVPGTDNPVLSVVLMKSQYLILPILCWQYFICQVYLMAMNVDNGTNEY